MEQTGAGVGPLQEIRILDLSRMTPGGFCTLLLGDLGAEIVKIEAPRTGDGLRAMSSPGQFNAAHTALNRGKRSVVLDLKNPAAAPVLTRLVRGAEVVIESHRPGLLDSLGIGYEAMSREQPRLVWCSITGFGDFGPNVGLPGHDLTYLGYSGLLDRLAGGPATPPSAVLSLPLAAVLAAVGILAGLAQVRRTGRGTRVDANMTDSAMWVLSEDVARAANAPGPGWGAFSARDVYTCGDGRQVTVASSEPRTWARLCQGLGDPDLAGHRPGVDDDGPVRVRLAHLFLTRPASDWLSDPGLAGGVGPVNEVADLLSDGQVTGRGSLVPLSGSDVRVLANPLRYHSASGGRASQGLSEPPVLGADTDDVLSAAGFTPEEISELRSAGVAGGAS